MQRKEKEPHHIERKRRKEEKRVCGCMENVSNLIRLDRGASDIALRRCWCSGCARSGTADEVALDGLTEAGRVVLRRNHCWSLALDCLFAAALQLLDQRPSTEEVDNSYPKPWSCLSVGRLLQAVLLMDADEKPVREEWNVREQNSAGAWSA